MFRKNISDQGTDRCISSDPLDNEIIERLFKKDIREGEEKLLLAVLSDAIEEFQKHVLSKDERGKKLSREVEEWFLEKDSDCLFSFEYICETLQLHPDYIRQGLLSWKEAKRKERYVQEHRGGRKTLVKTRVAHTSVRLSKTPINFLVYGTSATRTSIKNFKSLADCTPWPNANCPIVGFDVERESLWPAT